MNSQISQCLHRSRVVLASLAGIAAVCLALSAQAAYDSSSRDLDVTKSCTDFKIGGLGDMSATCNVWGMQGEMRSTQTHAIDLDDKIGFDDGALNSDGSDFSDKCDNESVTLSSDQLILKATCSDAEEAAAAEGKSVSIRIDDLLVNQGLETGVVGLKWLSEFGQAAPETAPIDGGAD